MTSLEAILVRMDHIDEVLQEIREQAKLTNGRVTTLEKWVERAKGAREALRWRAPVLVGVTCAVVGAVASRLLA